MGRKLVPMSVNMLTDYQRQTLEWLDAQPGPVREEDVWLSGVARWVDLPDLHEIGQAFEDSKGWHATRGWIRRNMAFLYREAKRVASAYRQYDRDECAAMLVPFIYQFARTMRPDGGATMLTYFGAFGARNLLSELRASSGLIRVPKWKNVARRKGELVLPIVTHFGTVREFASTGAPEPLAPDDGAHERAEARELWACAMRVLKPTYRRVLRRRMQGEMLHEIAQSMGLTRERVRQIEFAALNLVRERVGVSQLVRPKKAVAR
jgi:DNA-directed RNA polymerase specialized sigma24 family protein